jgi:hypothetical protein
VVVAGAGAGTQPSSPQPSVSTRASFSTAAFASRPWATTRTFAPCDTSSAMMAVMLRAFACRSPICSVIVEAKLFARFASTAAGRAWSPDAFGITMASDVTVMVPASGGAAPSLFTVTVSSVSLPADTDPSARSHDTTRSLLAITIWVSRLLA